MKKFGAGTPERSWTEKKKGGIRVGNTGYVGHEIKPLHHLIGREIAAIFMKNGMDQMTVMHGWRIPMRKKLSITIKVTAGESSQSSPAHNTIKRSRQAENPMEMR